MLSQKPAEEAVKRGVTGANSRSKEITLAAAGRMVCRGAKVEAGKPVNCGSDKRDGQTQEGTRCAPEEDQKWGARLPVGN